MLYNLSKYLLYALVWGIISTSSGPSGHNI